uniref:Lipoxygenase n=1 Tax=Gladiolus hybrid cultivar TaxID=263601 RepID=G3GC08_9ASPA|nr:lipoxygenase [Gladiolus hybrid cultivar]
MGEGDVEIKGKVVLIKKNVLSPNDFNATVLDDAQDFNSQAVSLQLVSATVGDPNDGNRGIVGEAAHLEEAISSLTSLAAGESEFGVTFRWEEEIGIPGAVIVKNNQEDEFFLKSITLEDYPGKGRIHCVCDSWVYNVSKYTYDRIFFANDTYLPANTPGPLKPYRDDELFNLRGDGVAVDKQLEEWDRVYDYAYYDDLGNPKDPRPVLGGTDEYPYPRRGKTGPPPTEEDTDSKSKPDVYVPRDEKFGHLKQADFLGLTLKSLAQSVIPIIRSLLKGTPNEYDSIEDVLKLFEGGLPVPMTPPINNKVRNDVPFEMLRSIFVTDQAGRSFLKFPLPDNIKEDKTAWKTDEEFARQMLAGVNPLVIRRLQEFPPTSKLDPTKYGNQNSTITAAHIEKNLEGLTVEQALSNNRVYILDSHDALMPYLNRINSTSNKIYATRTLLFLKNDDTLKPIAIELSLLHSEGEEHGAVSQVFTPSEVGVEGSIWQLAKAYVGVNDYGYHELISHWLSTHAVTEPFVIATNRHLSALHPINKLLVPHYRDTMDINASARQSLINAGGILESIVFPDKFAMEMSAVVYKSWNFMEQALPTDLIKRGLAEIITEADGPKLRLLIKDYPYASDGLEIWSAIETWVKEYCTIYYPNDATVQSDVELQAWWKEVREVGHGDLQNETWWPTMQTVSDLTQSCTIIIWLASALHAAVNFGQYAYNAFLPNRPTISRRFMPVPGTKEYEMLETNPDKVFLETITTEIQSITGTALMQLLSMHASDEVYLGTRDSPEWTTDQKTIVAFEKFGGKLLEIEEEISEKNKDPNLKNRRGPVELPYTLLVPTSSPGVTGKGIPNSVSI